MRLFVSTLSFVTCILVASPAVSQIIIAQENFTSYQADISTVPSKWHFSYHGNYTSTSFSGVSGPNSYKFGLNSASITAPKFTQADSVKFWVKGSGIDTVSAFIIFESADSISWDTLKRLDHLPTSSAKGNYALPVKSTTHFLKFKYIKSTGNLAFDDYKLIINASNVDFTSPAFSGCAPFCTNFTATSVTPIKSYQWDLGAGFVSNLAQPSHCYLNPGPYSVSLTIIDSLDNSYSITKSGYLTVYPAITADYTAPDTALVGTTIGFTDNSIGAVNWTWNFFDANDPVNSTLKNPTHTFADTGTYCPVLLAVNTFGCSDTVKHCLRINNSSTTALNNNILIDQLNYYASNNVLNFEFPFESYKNLHLKIYNTLGASFFDSKIFSNTLTLNTSDWHTGIYIMEVQVGSLRSTEKIRLIK